MPAIRRQSSDHSDEPYNPLFSGIKSYFKRVIGWFSNQQTEEEDGQQQQTARDQSEFSSLSQLNNQAPFKFAQSIQFEPTSMGFQDTNLNHTSTTTTTNNNNSNNSNNSNINNTNVNDSSLLLNTSGSSSGTNGHASIFAPSVMKPVPVRRTSSNTHDTIGIVKTFMRKRSSSDNDAESQSSSSSAMDIDDHVEHSAFSLYKPSSSLTSHVENGGSSSGAMDLNESIYPSIPSSSKMTTFRTPPSMPHTPVSADRRRSSLLSSRRSTPHPLASERMRMNAAEMRTPTSAASSSSSIMRRTTPTAGATPSSTFLSSRMNRSAMNSSVLSVGSMSGRSASSTRQAVDYLDPSCSHSETAKRILETLDQLSSPIVDLRRFSQTLYDDKVRDTRTLVDSAKKSKLSRESQFEEDEYERELSAHKRSSSKLSSSEQKRKRRQSQDLNNESQDLEDVPPFMGLDTSALTPHKKRREMPAASTAAVQPSLVERLPKTRKSLTPEPQREPEQKQPVIAVQKQQAPPSPEPQPKQKEPETHKQPEQPFEFSFTQQPAFQASPRKEITPVVKPIDTTSETKKPKKSASPYGRAGAKEADDQFYLEDQKNLAEMKEKESALSSAFSFSSSSASTNFSFDGFGTSEKKDEQHQETTTTAFAPPTTQPSTLSSGFSFEIPSKTGTSAQQEDEEEQAEPVKETKEPEPSPLAGFSFNSFNAPNDNKKTEVADTTEAPAMNGFSFGVQDKEKNDEVVTSAITFASTTSFTSSTTFSSSFGPSTGNDAFSAFSFGDKSSTSPLEINATEPEKAPEAPKTIEKEPDTTGFAVKHIDFSSISAQPLSFDTFGASSPDKTTTEQPSNLFQTSPTTPFSFGSTTEISKPAVIETPKSETTTAAPSEGFKFGGDTTSSATAVPSSFGFGGTSSSFQSSSEIKFGETSSSSASGGFTFGAAQDLATTPKDTGFSAPSSGFSFGLPQTTEKKSETSMPLFGGISSGGFGSTTTTTPSLQPATPETTDSTSFSTGFAFDANKSTPTTSAPSGGFAFGATTDLATPSTGFSAPSQSNVFVFGGANAQTSQPTGGGFTFGGASSTSFNAPALNSMGNEQSSSFAAPQNQSNPFAGFGSSTNGFAASNQTGFAANNNPFQPAAAAGISSPFPGQPAQSFVAPQASPFQMNQQPTAPQTGNPFSAQAFSGQAFSTPQANAFPAGNQPQLGQPGQPGPTRKYKVRKQPRR